MVNLIIIIIILSSYSDNYGENGGGVFISHAEKSLEEDSFTFVNATFKNNRSFNGGALFYSPVCFFTTTLHLFRVEI
jgi:hypothetical protein